MIRMRKKVSKRKGNEGEDERRQEVFLHAAEGSFFHSGEVAAIEIMDSGAIYMTDIQDYIGKSSTEANRKRCYREQMAKERKFPEAYPEYYSYLQDAMRLTNVRTILHQRQSKSQSQRKRRSYIQRQRKSTGAALVFHRVFHGLENSIWLCSLHLQRGRYFVSCSYTQKYNDLQKG